MTVETEARNAGLTDLVSLLERQRVRKIDMVAPATALHAKGGNVRIEGVTPILDDDGVTDPNGLYVPTRVFDEGVSEKLGIPLTYVRKMREARTDLWDANVNGWLHGRSALVVKGPDWNSETPAEGWVESRSELPGDSRSFLFRAFRGNGDDGIARALLSDKFGICDNLDVLLAVLDGVRAAGVDAVVDRASLTERRMSVDIVAPEISVLARGLLQGYRNPFGEDFDRWRRMADREGLGYGGEEPVVWAGLGISNSETGDGAFTIVPKAKIKVCANGLTITKDMVRQVHLGARLDHGIVNWSEETERANVDLIKRKTVDTVRSFLNVAYLGKTIDDMTEAGTRPVSDHEEVKVIAKRAKYTEAQTDDILKYFTRGGQMTRAGVMNAATAAAQMAESADVAFDMEQRAVALLTA